MALSWIGDIVGAKSAHRERKATHSFESNQAHIARDFSAKEAQKARDFSAAEAATARDWNERMSNTQNQRAAADLEAAGLNRILALGRPAGNAPAPMPGSATAGTAKASSGGNFTPPKPTGFMEMMQGKLLAAQADANSAQAAKTRAEIPGVGASSDIKEMVGLFATMLRDYLGRGQSTSKGFGDRASELTGAVEDIVNHHKDDVKSATSKATAGYRWIFDKASNAWRKVRDYQLPRRSGGGGR